MKKLVTVVILVIVLVAAAAGAFMFLGNQEGGEVKPPVATEEPAEQISVPVNVRGASNLGGLKLDIVYDSALLEATAVTGGELARNAMIESNLETPGRVTVGIIDVDGISGDGSVIKVAFKARGTPGTMSLALENLEAYDAGTLYEIVAESLPGEVVAGEGSFSAPMVTFD